MTFVDEVDVEVRAGRGGDGSAAMRSEPYKPKGGPEGGDGGRGGDVVFRSTRNLHDLAWFADHPHLRAEPGTPGARARRDGANGKDLVVPVPDGTVVFDERGLVADLVGEGAEAVVATGGRGGRGNTRFAGPKNRVPRTAEAGEEGEERRLHVELRTVADLGLVGLPNAGKSTLLAKLTAATPKIADYPVHHAHAQPGRRGGGRRTVRRGRYPRVGRRRPRGQGSRAPVPPAHHPMPSARHRRGPLLPARAVRPGDRPHGAPRVRSGARRASDARGGDEGGPRRGSGARGRRDPRPGRVGRDRGGPRAPRDAARAAVATGSRAAPSSLPVRGAPSRPCAVHDLERVRRLAGRRAQRGAVGARDGPRRRTGARGPPAEADQGRRRTAAREGGGASRRRDPDLGPHVRVPS